MCTRETLELYRSHRRAKGADPRANPAQNRKVHVSLFPVRTFVRNWHIYLGKREAREAFTLHFRTLSTCRLINLWGLHFKNILIIKFRLILITCYFYFFFIVGRRSKNNLISETSYCILKKISL